MGSEEESGKDWSELEEEAARGELKILYICFLICIVSYSANVSGRCFACGLLLIFYFDTMRSRKQPKEMKIYEDFLCDNFRRKVQLRHKHK